MHAVSVQGLEFSCLVYPQPSTSSWLTGKSEYLSIGASFSFLCTLVG